MADVESRRVYLAHKFHADQRNRPLIEQIVRLFEDRGIAVSCVVRDVERWGANHLEPGDLMRVAFDAIDGSDAVIIEISEKGVGLGIEAGYAYANEIPIFVIHQKGSEVSTTLLGTADDVFQYGGVKGLEEAVNAIAGLLAP